MREPSNKSLSGKTGGQAMTSTQDEQLRDAVKAAYIAGAMAVHNYWLANPGEAPQGDDPEFGEAASDYAASLPAPDTAACQCANCMKGEGICYGHLLPDTAGEVWEGPAYEYGVTWGPQAPTPDTTEVVAWLDTLRDAFMTSQSNGHPDPSERSYRLIFSFSNMDALHAAHSAMVHAFRKV